MENRKTQSAYVHGRDTPPAHSLEQLLRDTMYVYLREDLGLPESVAAIRADMESVGSVGRNVCDECEKFGIVFAGKQVVDLGAGLGSFSIEVARRHARLVAVEPGTAWRTIVSKRLSGMDRAAVIGAIGEQLPFRDNSVDLVVSLQVLEHVQNPAKVISEVFRILKPGGCFYMTYENYLSFWEPHYRVHWLPLLPKSLGIIYLRMLGRNPQFLSESITYTTYPAVRHYLKRIGFDCLRSKQFEESLRCPDKTGVKWSLLQGLARLNNGAAMFLLRSGDYARRMFRTRVAEWMQKPGA